jgi:hypothetical protein
MRTLVATVLVFTASGSLAADPVAPAEEVTSVTFSYFDGANWLNTWPGRAATYRLRAELRQGDPLGSVQDGDVKVLRKFSGTSADAAPGAWRVHQTGLLSAGGEQVVLGYLMRAAFEPAADGKVRVRLTLEHTDLQEGGPNEGVVRTSYKKYDRVIRDGETLRLRWGKTVAQGTWLELTVREDK